MSKSPAELTEGDLTEARRLACSARAVAHEFILVPGCTLKVDNPEEVGVLLVAISAYTDRLVTALRSKRKKG